MATSNVQLQEIISKLASLGFKNNGGPINLRRDLLKRQIDAQKQMLNPADKTDIHFYSINLEKLHNLQNSYDKLNSEEVTDLLKQKIELLEQLTS